VKLPSRRQSASLLKRRVTVLAASQCHWAQQEPGGKLVYVWAVEDHWDAADLQSNVFEMEWPPRSGRRQTFPELDRAAWFNVAEARAKLLKGQAVFIDQLLDVLGRI
jgi:predicted NUDIX family NTP pyrophosphohydrolase